LLPFTLGRETTVRRVVVTGMGVISPLGSTLDVVWDQLVNGHSGVGPITRFDTRSFKVKIGAEVKGFDPIEVFSRKDIRKTDPFVHFGMGAASHAFEHAGLTDARLDRDRVGVLAGTGIGGISIIEESKKVLMERGPSRISPFCIPQLISNIIAGHIAIRFGLKGPNFGIVSACTSGAHCIGESFRIIQHGEADVMIAGGTEAPITELSVAGFSAMRALSQRNDDPLAACRPFDADRDGFVIAEGAGMLVLEECEHAKRRGADIYCEISGYGRSCDAYHITAPDESGRGGARCMELAMRDAHLNPQDIDYLNAHGTSTELNDASETLAIKRAFGEKAAHKVAISSTKSMTGHLLGAAGAIEAVACVLAIRSNVVPPTINYSAPDPACDLNYTPNQAREMKVHACLSNSLGFGGHNATLCFKNA